MLGPGAIASVALVAPLAMAIGARTGLPPFLTALMVANGANAGNLSPLSAVGVIANTRMAAAGLGAHEWKVFAANFVAHVLVSAGRVRAARAARPRRGPAPSPDDHAARLTRPQWLTLSIVLLWVAAVVLLRAPIGLAAFTAAAAIVVLRAADEIAGDQADAVVGHPDGQRRDDAGGASWRRRAGWTCSRRCWRGSRRPTRSTA